MAPPAQQRMPGNDEAHSSRAAPAAPAACAGPATGTTRASSLPDFRAFSFSPMHQAAAALHNERTSHPVSEPLQVCPGQQHRLHRRAHAAPHTWLSRGWTAPARFCLLLRKHTQGPVQGEQLC